MFNVEKPAMEIVMNSGDGFILNKTKAEEVLKQIEEGKSVYSYTNNNRTLIMLMAYNVSSIKRFDFVGD